MNDDLKYFLPYQRKWILDLSPLKIMQKSRQVGISYADAYYSVRVVSTKDNRLDVYISSRDRFQAKLYIEDCKRWAEILHEVILDLGEMVLDPGNEGSAYVIQFANGKRIYSLSSNPNALAGKRGHVKLDEFALHQDQRLLYRIAKPVTMWGGTLSLISTHRGIGTLFNQLIRDILEKDNPMGWSLHTVPIENAVAQGLVEKINEKAGKGAKGEARPAIPSPGGEGQGEGGTSGTLDSGPRTQDSGPLSPVTRHSSLPPESRAGFLQRLRSECIDDEQWLQEYCCTPADESSAFFSYEMLNACEERNLALMSFDELKAHLCSASSNLRSPILYLGLDVARKHNLCVIDVGEKIGDVVWDRCRIELHNRPYSEIEFELYRLLALPQLKRACIDATGQGDQLAERARERFGWKVEAVKFTAPLKETLAYGLRNDFEERKLRIVSDEKLRADLRGLKKEVTASGNIRFVGETEDSHCDRTWAKALRQHAARRRPTAGGLVG